MDDIVDELVRLSREDWANDETSWDFQVNQLISNAEDGGNLKKISLSIRQLENSNTRRVVELETRNNELFTAMFGLESEVQPDIHVRAVTLRSNPQHRYDADKSESELEALLLADTIREFISYAVGCMLGRYSLDKPGPVSYTHLTLPTKA